MFIWACQKGTRILPLRWKQVVVVSWWQMVSYWKAILLPTQINTCNASYNASASLPYSVMWGSPKLTVIFNDIVNGEPIVFFNDLQPSPPTTTSLWELRFLRYSERVRASPSLRRFIPLPRYRIPSCLFIFEAVRDEERKLPPTWFLYSGCRLPCCYRKICVLPRLEMHFDATHKCKPPSSHWNSHWISVIKGNLL